MKDKKNIGLIVILVIIFTVIFYNIFLVVISGHNDSSALALFGNKAYVITTESMKPKIKKGDLIIVRKNNNGYEINDIITFYDKGEYITHRIIRKNANTYITKGDCNDYEDKDQISEEAIEGKMIFKIPIIGGIIEKIDNVLYIFVLIILILTIIIHRKRMSRKSIMRRIKKEDADRTFREKEKTKKEGQEKKKQINNISDSNLDNTNNKKSK